MQEGQVRRGLPLLEFLGVQRQQALEQGGVVRTGQAMPVEHLVVRRVQVVRPEGRKLGERAGTGPWGNRHGQQLEVRLAAVKP